MLTSFSVDCSVVSGCTFTKSSNVLSFNSLCISSAVGNTSTISIVLSNVTNPKSFKPTASFGF